MAENNPSPIMRAEDTAAAFSGFTIALVSALADSDLKDPNEVLAKVTTELRDLVAGMIQRGDTGTPAAEAMLITAAMLEASAPPGEKG